MALMSLYIGSETHLSCNIFNKKFLPKHYTASRQDRTDGKGGIIIIYKESLIVKVITWKAGEIVSIKIKTFEKPILITACYRTMYNSKEQNQELIDSLRKIIVKHKNISVWVGGDFNLPDIDWHSSEITVHQVCKRT